MPAAIADYLRREQARNATDAELLGRYARDRDGTAFAELVTRHGPMVRRLCRRLAPAEADDAFQAVFLVLSRQAGAIRAPEALAAWLYGVARRVGAKAARRKSAVARPARPAADPFDEVSSRELFDILDAELARLREADRQPLILVYWQGRSYAAAARELGLTPGAFHGRLERARQRLAARLRRRGIGPGDAAVLLAVPLANPAVPPGVAAGAALLGAKGAAVPAGVAALAGAAVAPAAAAAGWLALTFIGLGTLAALSAQTPAPTPRAPASSVPAALADAFGDPLPQGAVRRLGTTRLRHSNAQATAFSEDGRRLFTAGRDRMLREWDPVTGKLLARRQFSEEQYVSAITLSPGGRLIAFQPGTSDVFLVWDAQTQAIRHTLTLDERWSHTARFSPDGRTLVTAQHNGTVRAWDMETGAGRTLGQYRNIVYSIAFSADSRLVVAATLNEPLRGWDLATGAELFRHTNNAAGHVELSPDGKTLLWNANGTVEFCNTADGSAAKGWVAPPGRFGGSFAFSPDGKRVVLSSDDGATIWDPAAGRAVHRLPGQSFGWPVFAPDGSQIAALAGGCVLVWDCVKGELHPANRSDDAHTGVVNAVTQSPCGRWIATASSDDKSLRLQRADDGRVVWRRSTAYVGHNGLRFSPDGGSLYAGVGNAVAVIDVQTGQDRQRFPLDSADGAERHFHLLKFELSRDARTLLGVTQLTMGPNSRRFPNQSANYDWGIIRWDAATGRRISQAINRETKHTWVGYSGITPDCDLIVNGPVMVDPATGQERMRLRVPEESERLRVEHPLAFSADAALVAGALQHHIPLEIGGYTTRIDEVQVWEAATLRPIVRVPTGETAVLKFTPDGRHLISCGLRAITVWELPSGRQVRSFTVEHAGRGVYGPTFVTASWLSADGQTLITGLPDTTALVWRLDLPAPGPAAPLSPDKLSACWNDLGSDDAGAAWRAIDALAQRPAQALALVTPHLRPAGDLTAEVRRLLGELDAPGFDQRERASRRLAELWSDAEEQLREALNGPLGAEARRRVEALLTEPPTVRGREECRMLRVVTVLQRIGTPEARAALATLSRGAVNARLTRAAAMALTL